MRRRDWLAACTRLCRKAAGWIMGNAKGTGNSILRYLSACRSKQERRKRKRESIHRSHEQQLNWSWAKIKQSGSRTTDDRSGLGSFKVSMSRRGVCSWLVLGSVLHHCLPRERRMSRRTSKCEVHSRRCRGAKSGENEPTLSASLSGS